MFYGELFSDYTLKGSNWTAWGTLQTVLLWSILFCGCVAVCAGTRHLRRRCKRRALPHVVAYNAGFLFFNPLEVWTLSSPMLRKGWTIFLIVPNLDRPLDSMTPDAHMVSADVEVIHAKVFLSKVPRGCSYFRPMYVLTGIRWVGP